MTLNTTNDLHVIQARQLLGQVLHTLQDFYSHSNWIELGNTQIHQRLGLDEDIGPIAGLNQSTCTNDGCVKTITKCVRFNDECFLHFHVYIFLKNFLQKVTLRTCPLEYYICKGNIRSDIVEQHLLTSGYSINQYNENNEPIVKPKHVDKCSHGSVMDTSSHQSPIGGINKDTVIAIYSPHFHLQ
jgi:von Willebrand factor A domain-containing protein 7